MPDRRLNAKLNKKEVLYGEDEDLASSPFIQLAKSTRHNSSLGHVHYDSSLLKGKKRMLHEDDYSSDDDVYDCNVNDESQVDGNLKVDKVNYSLASPPPRPIKSNLKSFNSKLSTTNDCLTDTSNQFITTALPQPVQHLIELHDAIEKAMRIHLSTSNSLPVPVIIQHSSNLGHSDQPNFSSLLSYFPNSIIYRYNSLIDLTTLSKLIKSTTAKNLNAQTLSRLRYLWNDDLGYVISTTRGTEYAIGIEVALDNYDQSAQGAIGVMRNFVRAKDAWFKESENRKNTILKRAQIWVNEQFEQWMNYQLDEESINIKTPLKTPTKSISSSVTRSGLLTPPSTTTKNRLNKSPASPIAYPKDFIKSITNTPSKVLPQLSMKATAPVKRARVKSPSPPPKSIRTAKPIDDDDDDNVFKTPSKPNVTREPRSLSMAERRKNLQASILAKQEQKKKAKESDFTPQKGVSSETFQRRSRLSRLPAVAEAVYLLFAPNVSSVPSSPSASLPTPTSRKRRARPLNEVSQVIVKSSKVAMSVAEAVDSLKMLCKLCPDFLFVKVVDKVEYLEMPTSTSVIGTSQTHNIIPPSPNNHPLLAATTPKDVSPSKYTRVSTPPCSPRSPKSPLTGKEFESPSKRSSLMTLRDVRRVIELELSRL